MNFTIYTPNNDKIIFEEFDRHEKMFIEIQTMFIDTNIEVSKENIIDLIYYLNKQLEIIK